MTSKHIACKRGWCFFSATTAEKKLNEIKEALQIQAQGQYVFPVLEIFSVGKVISSQKILGIPCFIKLATHNCLMLVGTGSKQFVEQQLCIIWYTQLMILLQVKILLHKL